MHVPTKSTDMPSAILKRGFTMLEVLVTLVILMFGLLGLAGLIVKGQKNAFDAYQQQFALSLANDMAEKIKANPAGVTTYTATSLSNMAGSSSWSASGAGRAAADLLDWHTTLRGAKEQLVTGSSSSNAGGILSARGCIELIGAIVEQTYRVSVAWEGKNSSAALPESQGTGITNSSACGNGLTHRRVVSLDVTLIS